MAKYYVEVPVVMKLMVGVEADSKQEAIDKVFEGDISVDLKDDKDQFEYIDWEWDMYEKIVQGNVFYGAINEIHIEEEEE